MKQIGIIVLILLFTLTGCINVHLTPGSNNTNSNSTNNVNGDLPRIEYFGVNPTSIVAGQTATITWLVSNSTIISIEPAIGTVDIKGDATVSPIQTTSYIITAQNPQGISTETLTLTVGTGTGSPSADSRPVIVSFTAVPPYISSGSFSTLDWIVTGATDVKISGIGPVSSSGSNNVYPTATTSYMLEAQNSAGITTASATITVSSSPTPTPGGSRPGVVYFNANPSTTTSGGTVELSWDIYNASSVILDPGFGAVAPTSSILVYPATTTTYTLTAQNAAGTTIATQTVTVTGPIFPSGGPPIIDYFYAVPNHIYEGSSTTLKWRASNAVRFTIIEPNVTLFYTETTASDVVLNPIVSTHVTRGADLEYILTAYSASGDSAEARTILHVEVP
jgi:hypothetical protein